MTQAVGTYDRSARTETPGRSGLTARIVDLGVVREAAARVEAAAGLATHGVVEGVEVARAVGAPTSCDGVRLTLLLLLRGAATSAFTNTMAGITGSPYP